MVQKLRVTAARLRESSIETHHQLRMYAGPNLVFEKMSGHGSSADTSSTPKLKEKPLQHRTGTTIVTQCLLIHICTCGGNRKAQVMLEGLNGVC